MPLLARNVGWRLFIIFATFNLAFSRLLISLNLALLSLPSSPPSLRKHSKHIHVNIDFRGLSNKHSNHLLVRYTPNTGINANHKGARLRNMHEHGGKILEKKFSICIFYFFLLLFLELCLAKMVSKEITWICFGSIGFICI